MVNSIKSWDSINEGYATAKGKQIILIDGKRIKLVYKAQNDKQLLVKLIRTIGVIDESGKLTPKGAGALLNFFNSQIGIVNSYGKFDANFFSKKVLVYSVLKDTNRTEKIQFTIVDRSSITGLDQATQFISIDALQKVIETNPDLKVIVDDTQQKVKNDDVQEEPEVVKSGEEDDAKGTTSTMRASGVRFRYEMRSNSTLYSMEFTEDGAIDSSRVKGNGVNGQVSWENNAPFWYTNSDNTVQGFQNAQTSTDPLAIDGEITNSIDKEFFTKVFTDDEFLQKIVDEYNEKYADLDINGDTIKSMLYHPDGTKLFPEEGETAQSDESTSGESGENATTGTPKYYGGIHA